MSLEYYLFCREKYGFILNHLEQINELFDNVINLTENENCIIEKNYYNIFLTELNSKSIEKIKENVEKLKNICNNKIIELCDHDYINDLIDITPDRSENIIYCQKCGYTK
jgi:hypothetical protein